MRRICKTSCFAASAALPARVPLLSGVSPCPGLEAPGGVSPCPGLEDPGPGGVSPSSCPGLEAPSHGGVSPCPGLEAPGGWRLSVPRVPSHWRLSRRAAAAGSLLRASELGRGGCLSHGGSEWREFSRTSSEIDGYIQHRDRPRPVAAVLI